MPKWAPKWVTLDLLGEVLEITGGFDNGRAHYL